VSSDERKSTITKPGTLNEALNKRLAAYALCAGATGLGLLTTMPAEASVVYTPAHVSLSPGTTYDLDLDADGITDFHFRDVPFGIFGALLTVSSNSVLVGLGREPYALAAGAKISASRHFFSCSLCSYGNVIEALNSSSYFGYWHNVTNHYLGLKFTINGETHFGWARLSVRVGSRSISARLSGYAYETNPNKGIRAGQTSDNESRANGSLGSLARGAQ
jgi:hypothetical protein